MWLMGSITHYYAGVDRELRKPKPYIPKKPQALSPKPYLDPQEPTFFMSFQQHLRALGHPRSRTVL